MRRFLLTRKSLGAWLTLGVSLTATTIGWQTASTLAVMEHETVFKGRTLRLSQAITTRMQIYTTTLRAAAAFVDLSPHITRADWRSYVERLNITTHYPGIQGLGYTVPLSPKDVEAHNLAVRAEGFPDYTVWPTDPRPRYTAILYLEPMDWRNRRALGFDMMSKPIRGAAMARARDSGEPATSGVVELVQETDVAPQAGFLIYVPVYRDGARPQTVDQRRQLLRGWVYSPFRMDDLMHGIYDSEPPDIHMRIYDGASTDGAALLHDSAAAGFSPSPASSPLFTRAVQVTAAGRPWTVVFSSPPEFEKGVGRSLPYMVLGGGLVTSLLLFISVAALSARRQVLLEGYAVAQRALEEKEVLLKEVHHRVKNSLQIVVSMLTLQGLKADDPSIRGELDKAVARVRAVAKIHERLYGGADVTRVDFAGYLRALCADLQEAAPEHALRVEARSAFLATEQAVPLGLICVELITNAIKHARAPEHRRAIDIGFGATPEGDLVLSVRDYGVGLDQAFSLEQPRSSLGIRAMQAFALQLDASLSFESARPGARWIVRIPSHSGVEPLGEFQAQDRSPSSAAA